MNDFTKEELEDLAAIVSVYYVKYMNDTATLKLRDKIEAIIHNYEFKFKPPTIR